MKQKKQQSQIEVQEVQVQIKKPSLFKVFLLNDNETPMEFVVEVLQKVFGMTADRAMQVMYQAHSQGKAESGTFSKDVAETKVAQVAAVAKRYGHPMRCEMEEVT
jgi:ATP-dependent Clp protease adaptor protein ClpS